MWEDSVNSKDYLDQLVECISKYKINVIHQIGKSNIEPIDVRERVENWIQQILDIVQENPPEYYVSVLTLLQDDDQHIYEITYTYCNEFEFADNIVINLSWKE